MAEGRIPLPSIRRFPSYLRILMQKKDAGERDISATLLAHELGLTAIQVRKDLASTGVEGRPKVGFSIEELIVAITHSLGWDNAAEALIIGAGNLGSALAAYNGFSAYGLSIAAIFDKDPGKIGKRIGHLTVLPVDTVNQYIKSHRVTIAVLAVPANQAQAAADMLVKCGIRGIWNFAPMNLRVPDDVVMQRTDLAASFAVLSIMLRRKYQEETQGEEAPQIPSAMR